MSVSMKSFGLDQLTPAERIELAQELWDSVAAESGQVPMTQAQQEDLQRRLDEFADDPQAGHPWEEVKARLLVRR